MSLRARLLTAMLVLITVALVIAAVSIYADQRSFLLSHLDQRVVATAAPISYQLGVDATLLRRPRPEPRPAVGSKTRPKGGKGLVGFLPSGTYGALVGPRGEILRGPVTVNYGDRRLPGPALPSRFPTFRAGTSPKLFTVGSKHGSNVHYRVAAIALESGNGTLLVAVPLRDVDQTLDQLIIVEALVVASVILVLVGLGWIVIRIALRPLDHMGKVASAIAEGDLSRRVSPANGRTEVGRLGMSLNKMLVRIEHAFADRENSEERRRQFLSDASHELRTPLASIRGYAELFRLGPAQDPAALQRAMDRIESEATRMGILVEDLLALARLDELPEERQERIDLTDLGAHAVADARAMAPDRSVTMQAPDRLEVLGDPNSLRQVLANLIGNAVLHTPDASPVQLVIKPDGRDAVVEVRDHGPGLVSGTESRVFERFWRGDSEHSRDRNGSGLGLAIVREIIDSHHGNVVAANHPDGGAVFTVRLPLAPPVHLADGRDRAEPAIGIPVA